MRPQWLKFVGMFFNRDGLGSANADTQAVRGFRRAAGGCHGLRTGSQSLGA
jgi:hypothetical protein